MKNNIVIIDYGVGNTHSVYNALQYLGYNPVISNEVKNIQQAEVLILPGVGAFEEAMHNIKVLRIKEILEEEVLLQKKPVLGICLGMQILAEDSEENGHHKGLGWIPGHIKRIPFSDQHKVPHVGWNNIKYHIDSPLFLNNRKTELNFYFDHSYHFECDKKYSLATTDHGEKMNAIVQKDNIFGVQFHPEKSQVNGLKLFRSFFNYLNTLS